MTGFVVEVTVLRRRHFSSDARACQPQLAHKVTGAGTDVSVAVEVLITLVAVIVLLCVTVGVRRT